jgi:purine-binding chemotaxis protein CheW
LLQDATEEEQPVLVLEPVLEPESTLDEFQLAVLEEQARDAKPLVAPVQPR